ncbi:M10 family metallopeptidase C-terminal domain-containing protein, partial [Pseudomonas gingeri]|nr:M10 family metallopeptidase C-terminal domain-containing protein [Pseudomonas gingeri]
GVRALVFTDRFSGRAGEAVIKHDPSTGLSSLAIDLKGTGKADLLLKSKGEIKPTDVLSEGQAPEVQPAPVPKPTPAPAPTPAPPPPVPTPAPAPLTDKTQ